MQFKVVDHPRRVPETATMAGFLVRDRWDDWGEFETLFELIIFDAAGNKHKPGGIKIGQFGLKGGNRVLGGDGSRSPAVPREFRELDDRFFSLGQDDSYYSTLAKLGEDLRGTIFRALRDVAADTELWNQARNEKVTRISLLRSVKPKSVEGQFRRLAQGGARLTPYQFSYQPPKWTGATTEPLQLTFSVEPDSNPSTNIHVLIGRNGVGKTHTLHSMTRALVAPESIARRSGEFSNTSDDPDSPPVANLVSVSFSAFDHFELMPEKRDPTEGIQYSYIGLRRVEDSGKGRGTPKSPTALRREFVNSVKLCVQGARLARWRRALESLETDPLFKEAEVTELTSFEGNSAEFEEYAADLFDRLSSGHKIVLLTITRLVETVEEQTLVLIDEPEAHLHPPLLSSFVRTLSDLLINRNGVAIIATHSPVVLQEVPKKCVWIIHRTGEQTDANRPESETFGENVGVLTREVFRLEVAQSGFHSLLSIAVSEEPTYEAALERFGGELGGEARAILRALFNTKHAQGHE
jgi:ABC-type cobalamin/Fe3+-siderophores transport system ATPase subunit